MQFVQSNSNITSQLAIVALKTKNAQKKKLFSALNYFSLKNSEFDEAFKFNNCVLNLDLLQLIPSSHAKVQFSFFLLEMRKIQVLLKHRQY